MNKSAEKSTRRNKLFSAHEIQLRTALLHRSLTVSGLADRLQVSHSMVSQLISGKRRSRRLENRIAGMIGIPRENLFKKQVSP